MTKKPNLKPWTTISAEEVLTTPWFRIKKYAMRTSSGIDATYFIHHADDGVLAFCVTEDNLVLIERQYRPPVQKICVDYPGGKIEAEDIDVSAAMQRELHEEAGFEVTNLKLLGTLDKDPGLSEARMHVFLAQGAIVHKPRPDPTESISLEFVTPRKLMELIKQEEMNCTHCISATFLAFNELGWSKLSLP